MLPRLLLIRLVLVVTGIHLLSSHLFALTKLVYPPLVNQMGYNLYEPKRFVCYGAKDNTKFWVKECHSGDVVYEGVMLNQQGWFTEYNPQNDSASYTIEVEGHGTSVPFWIADHLFEAKSSKLAYDFFTDVRGFADLEDYDMSAIYGGGPSRDGGAYGLETIFEILQYASNPALFNRWNSELGERRMADLIALILWHAEFAYKFVNYNGPVNKRHGTLGYEGESRMSYDYWNTLDQLSAVCAAYHVFLKPYLSEENYRKYRKVCLDKWEEYDRHKVVRYWTYSTKWVDSGFQEFNEMGNAYGQSVFRNLFMYMCELNEPDGEPEKFLSWAQDAVEDIIQNWDFNNPRHMWWIRNAEHITPQSLIFFLINAPEKAPEGTLEKLNSWSVHIQQKCKNFWKYRTHSEKRWAHPQTKELGGSPALAGSLFGASHLLDNPELRKLAWAQVDFVFGVNPVGSHLGHKSQERLEINGYWEGVEKGWPQSHPNGFGELGRVRGVLDGSPLNSHFPIAREVAEVVGNNDGQDFGKNAYATEGWCISNRGWQSSVTFSTLGSHSLEVLPKDESIPSGTVVRVVLKAALNLDPELIETGWVMTSQGEKIIVTETGKNTGLFTADYRVNANPGDTIQFRYGYFGFEKVSEVKIH